jgi:hypothetical protein
MFAIALPLCFGFIFLFCYSQLNHHDTLSDWRPAFLSAAIVWALLVVTIAELLSAFNLLTFSWTLGCWGMMVVLSAGLATRRLMATGRPKWMPFRLEPAQTLMLLSVVGIVAIIGLIAGLAPPNTGDSMTYHMSRVMHWIQNHNVAYYPTQIVRQLYQPPWAEYAILQLQLLSGGDRLANFVQWFSQLGSLVGVSLLAKQFGAGRQGQAAAVVICATIPMGILQASSTKNDYVAAFWLVCFVYFFLQYKDNRQPFPLCATGASLGLAWLTKATPYIYTLPFLIWFGAWAVKTLRWQLWRPVLVIASLSLLINLPLYSRNMQLFGNPLGPGQEPFASDTDPTLGQAIAAGMAGTGISYTNDTLTVPLALSNIIRNIGLHTITPSAKFNAALEKSIKELHQWLGIEMNDPRTTWVGREFHIPTEPYLKETRAGNPLHLLLIIAAVIYYLARWSSTRSHETIYCAFALTSAFLIFCFYLRWQPWHSRLHLPLFVLWSPLIAVALYPLFNGKLANVIALVLVLATYPSLFTSTPRPLLGTHNVLVTNRLNQYFEELPRGAEAWFVGATQFIKAHGCSQVGLLAGSWNDWEYPWWVLLQQSPTSLSRLEHVQVNNPSAALADRKPFDRFDPCAIIEMQWRPETIIATNYSNKKRDEVLMPGGVYTSAWALGPVQVFLKKTENQ